MIKNLTIRNFKSFLAASISFENLTVLTGLNGLGKSTIIQVLLLLKQSYDKNLLQGKGLSLKGEILDLGKGRDVYNSFAKDEFLSFEIIDEMNNVYKCDFKYAAEADLLPIQENISFNEITLLKNGFKYLSAERVAPKHYYELNRYFVETLRELGHKGEYTTHFIAHNQREILPIKQLIHEKSNSNNLLSNIDAWLSEISPGIKIKTMIYPELEVAKLSYQFEMGDEFSQEISPINVGFGYSYVLPVITLVLASKPGDLIIIENPESHLHPRGQSKLGELFSIAAQNGVHLIIETHSDHIINGIRVAVKKELINSDKTKIHFIDRNLETDKESYISTIRIDGDGRISDYPKGFMDEFENQLDELI